MPSAVGVDPNAQLGDKSADDIGKMMPLSTESTADASQSPTDQSPEKEKAEKQSLVQGEDAADTPSSLPTAVPFYPQQEGSGSGAARQQFLDLQTERRGSAPFQPVTFGSGSNQVLPCGLPSIGGSTTWGPPDKKMSDGPFAASTSHGPDSKVKPPEKPEDTTTFEDIKNDSSPFDPEQLLSMTRKPRCPPPAAAPPPPPCLTDGKAPHELSPQELPELSQSTIASTSTTASLPTGHLIPAIGHPVIKSDDKNLDKKGSDTTDSTVDGCETKKDGASANQKVEYACLDTPFAVNFGGFGWADSCGSDDPLPLLNDLQRSCKDHEGDDVDFLKQSFFSHEVASDNIIPPLIFGDTIGLNPSKSDLDAAAKAILSSWDDTGPKATAKKEGESSATQSPRNANGQNKFIPGRLGGYYNTPQQQQQQRQPYVSSAQWGKPQRPPQTFSSLQAKANPLAKAGVIGRLPTASSSQGLWAPADHNGADPNSGFNLFMNPVMHRGTHAHQMSANGMLLRPPQRPWMPPRPNPPQQYGQYGQQYRPGSSYLQGVRPANGSIYNPNGQMPHSQVPPPPPPGQHGAFVVNGNQRQYSNTSGHHGYGSQRSQSPEQEGEEGLEDHLWGQHTSWDAKASPTMRAKGARKGSFAGAANDGPQIVVANPGVANANISRRNSESIASSRPQQPASRPMPSLADFLPPTAATRLTSSKTDDSAATPLAADAAEGLTAAQRLARASSSKPTPTVAPPPVTQASAWPSLAPTKPAAEKKPAAPSPATAPAAAPAAPAPAPAPGRGPAPLAGSVWSQGIREPIPAEIGDPNLPPEKRYKTELEQMQAMGLDRDAALNALVKTHGNINQAMEIVFG